MQKIKTFFFEWILPGLIFFGIGAAISAIVYFFSSDFDNDMYVLGHLIGSIPILSTFFGVLYHVSTKKLNKAGNLPLWGYFRVFGLSGIIISIINCFIVIFKYNIDIFNIFYQFNLFKFFEYKNLLIGSVILLTISEILRYLECISESIKNNQNSEKQ